MERRKFIGSGGVLGAAIALPGSGSAAAPRPSGKTFVLVHGAWHGAWCWERLTPHLQAAGHQVRALTLAGMGERIGEMSTAIDLDTHIADVVSFIRTQDLRHVVLVGHSYGGFPVTGAVERLAAEHRIDTVIYLDAFVPANGDRMFNYLDAAGKVGIESAFRAGNPRWPKLPARFFGLHDAADIAYVDARLTDHPSGTYLQPIALTAPPAAGAARRVYISAVAPSLGVFDAGKARLRQDPGWTYLELQAGHDAMVDRAALLAGLLNAHT